MTPRYPHKVIQVGDSKWDIYVVPPTRPKLGKGNWGRCQMAEKAIYISNRLGKNNFKLTLTHELIHACHDELGWDRKLVEKFRRSGNEKLVDSMACVLMPFMKETLFSLMKQRQRTRV